MATDVQQHLLYLLPLPQGQGALRAVSVGTNGADCGASSGMKVTGLGKQRAIQYGEGRFQFDCTRDSGIR